MDAYDGKARVARLRLIGIGVVAGAVLAGGGVLIGTAVSGNHDVDSTRAEDREPGESRSGSLDPDNDSSRDGTSAGKVWTPETARAINPIRGSAMREGISVGFEHSGRGASSAVIRRFQELDFLDDTVVRRQLTVVASKDSPEVVDGGVSEVRRIREEAGLPPSGHAPAGLTVTTTVKAARSRALQGPEEVVEVWLMYDRYATTAEKPVDDQPLRDQLARVIVKWEDGDWKQTEEERYTRQKTRPVDYVPDEVFSWRDGWRRVAAYD